MRKLILMTCVLAAAACAHSESAQKTEAAAAPPAPKAEAVLEPTSGNQVQGTVTFTQVADGVLIRADVTGLTPGNHGFHVHENGDCSSPDAKSAGGHYNPHAHHHGAPVDAQRHTGDLGNLVADDSGHAVLEWTDPDMKLTGESSVVGRAVIVHAGEDDYTTQPTGNAGARVACGVIAQ